MPGAAQTRLWRLCKAGRRAASRSPIRAMRTRMAPLRPTKPERSARGATTSRLPESIPTPADLSEPQPLSPQRATSRSRNSRITQPQQSYQPQPQQSYPGQSYQPQPPQYPGAELPAAGPAELQLRAASPIPAQPAYQPSRAATPSRMLGFPDRIFPAEATQHAGHAEQEYDDTNYANASYGDASFQDASFPDASFPDASFPEEKAEQDYAQAPAHHDGFGAHDALHLDEAAAPYGTESGPESFADQSGHDYQAGHDCRSSRHTPRRRVLCRRIRLCRPSMPSTTSRRRSRLAAPSIQTKCRRRTRPGFL